MKISAVLIFILGFMLLTDEAGLAISITLTGTWSEIIDGSDLQAGAGSDLKSTYESASDQVLIDISEKGDWWVDIKRVDSVWHNNFHLYVKRTSDGTGDGSISGGSTYQEVTDTYQNFFSGNKNRSDIHIQLKLSGVSVQIPLGNYLTSVYYMASH